MKLYLIIGAIGVIITGLVFSHAAVYRAGQKSVEVKVLKETAKAEVKYEELKKEVITLDHIALRKRFCEWVRDNKNDCLQADIPIREGSVD